MITQKTLMKATGLTISINCTSKILQLFINDSFSELDLLLWSSSTPQDLALTQIIKVGWNFSFDNLA
jgi:hypothetical protein